MQYLKFLSKYSCRLVKYGQLRCLHIKPDAFVIVAATRTPWGKCHGQLAAVSALQLGQMAMEAAVKQSAVPLEEIQQIFMNEQPQLQRMEDNKLNFSTFLKQSKYIAQTVTYKDETGMDSLLKAIDALKSSKSNVVAVGGQESASQEEHFKSQSKEITQNYIFPAVPLTAIENYTVNSVMRYTKSQKEGLYEAEMVPLKIQQVIGKKRFIREIKEDEISENSSKCNRKIQYSDGAAALILTTHEKAQKLHLSPLAVITDFEHIKNSSNILIRNQTCVENLFKRTKISPELVKHWEIEDSIPQLVIFLKQYFKLNLDLINPHGGSFILGHSAAASLTRLITHLTHALKPTEYGCVVSSNSQESLSLIIQKLLPLSTQGRLPLITLYTKDPCPLCDILVEELELNFPGEYELAKVFIDSKHNLRFLRLYRLDIPVVFLNNQFLCIHHLNHRLLRKKLDVFNKLEIKY